VNALNEAIMKTAQVAATVAPAEQKRQAYLNWADATLRRLRTVFSDSQQEDSLASPVVASEGVSPGLALPGEVVTGLPVLQAEEKSSCRVRPDPGLR
jgi:hypothetical protein